MEISNGFKKVAFATTLFTVASGMLSAQGVAPVAAIPSAESRIALSADFLLWKANGESAPLGYTTEGNGVSEKPKFKPGFRIGAEYVVGEHDEWKVRADWTHLNGKAKGEFNSTVVEEKNRINLVDLSLGKDLSISPKVTVAPHAGFRAVNFRNVQGVTLEDALNTEAHYRGFGVRTGICSAWALSSEFALIGKFATTLASGTAKEVEYDTSAKVSKSQRIRFNVESFFGVQWNKEFDAQKSKLSLTAGYELSQWIHVAKDASSVGFHGLTAKASYSF